MRFKLSSAVAAVVIAMGVAARGAEPTTEELRQEIAALQSRLESLEKRSSDRAATDATVSDVLRDAEKRSAPGGGSATAGYDKGFFIRSEDGNFLLKPSVLSQFRNVTNFRTGDDEDIQNGFENRRLRLRFDGNVFTPKLTYRFQWDTSRTNGSVSLLDAWTQYQFADTWALKLGQFKEVLFHERDVSAFDQLAVDRSLVDAVLGGAQTDRVQGVSLIYGKSSLPVRMEVAFTDGANSRNTNFQDGDTNFGVAGRAEYRFLGRWADYKDFTAKNTKENLFIIGAGADLTESGGTNVLRTTVDAQYKTPAAITLYGALHGNVVDNDNSNFDWGAVGQVGYLISPKWEPFGRYDVIVVSDNNGQDAYNEFAVGVNYYLGENGSYGNRAKVSVDLLYLPEGAPSDQTTLGILGSNEAEFVVRAQFQLVL